MPFLWNKIFAQKLITPIISQIKTFFSTLLASKSPLTFFLIGIFNGYPPCGLVYAGLAKATATDDFFYGSIQMIAFGLGTLPLMFVFGIFSNFLTLKVRSIGNKIAQVWLVILGFLFILRGLSLGIPYLSPILDSVLGVSCCH